MGKAQGERRGSLPAEPEEQYAGGDAAALGASDDVARRTRAFKAYRTELARLDMQEVWTDGVLTYRDGITGRPRAIRPDGNLPSMRRAALGYS